MVNTKYDIAIIGGGLAGLTLSILCAEAGYKTIVFEKSSYPKHKVCGEYISLESYDFLLSLGLPLDKMNLPIIKKFVLTSHYGLQSSCKLDPGGFGISRYKIDTLLAELAKSKKVDILEQNRITSIERQEAEYAIKSTSGEIYHSSLVVGSFGRISGVESNENNDKSKFIGVKYHFEDGPEKDVIEIHNFRGGYCGTSAIEDGKYCLCYLAKADGLKKHKGNIEAFEKEFLHQNPFLKKRMESKKLIEPVVTSQLFFGVSDTSKLSYPRIGDASGFIPPITGNGMSLAFRSANDIMPEINKFFDTKDLTNLIGANSSYANKYLKGRINKGIFLQDLLFIDYKILNQALMYGLIYLPGMMKYMTKQAVGEKINSLR